MNLPARAVVDFLSPVDLSAHGIADVAEVIYNPSFERLFEEETAEGLSERERCTLTSTGAVAVDTGAFTGRSPKDKYIVEDALTRETLWWAGDEARNDNTPISESVWADLKTLVTSHLTGKRLFVVDAYCGANESTRLSVRFVTEVAWQAHFVTNMFIRPSINELATFEPDFVVMNAASVTNADYERHGMNSENFVAFNFTEKMQLIGTPRQSICRQRLSLKSTARFVATRCSKTL